MEKVIADIASRLRQGQPMDAAALAQVMRTHNQGIRRNEDHHSKTKLLAFYLEQRGAQSPAWQRWGLSAEEDAAVLAALQAKPRRTASGIASITVITKPWPCTSNCLYCPNDLRMPKSYLHDEPACQRAERNYFDPYLQVTARLRSLMRMGHVTDKVEIIILGGTWSDYPQSYQVWFVEQVFRALNDAEAGTNLGRVADETRSQLEKRYQAAGVSANAQQLQAAAAAVQQQVDEGSATYAQAYPRLYGEGSPWHRIAAGQTANLAQLEAQQRTNETAAHRVVGLVVETRPDLITPEALTLLRRLGCTKVQMGIQSLRPEVLRANHRHVDVAQIQRAFALLRLFGFKSHTHFMVNLLGATPEEDKADFKNFVTSTPYLPDEVKLYPCFLIGGTGLCTAHTQGRWRAYPENTLVDVLACDVLETPAYTRISRMIRDFSSQDIAAGCKKTNLRQMVEAEVARRCTEEDRIVQEIRMREIACAAADPATLQLADHTYETSTGTEHFLQWVTPENRIAGFLRLSLPNWEAAAHALPEEDLRQLPVAPGQAMIREVHVYGKVARLHGAGENAQHMGLGTALVNRACEIARANGCERINVISSVGTRGYYDKLGFTLREDALYQQKPL